MIGNNGDKIGTKQEQNRQFPSIPVLLFFLFQAHEIIFIGAHQNTFFFSIITPQVNSWRVENSSVKIKI